jgi:membrane protease YdiL (CAAX protease family)
MNKMEIRDIKLIKLKKLRFNSISSTIFILIIFIAITISEYIFAYRDVTYGIVLSLFITLSIYIIVSVAFMRADYMRSAESLALIPLYVLFTSSLPWFFINQQYLIPAVYSVILALCFWHMNEHNIDFRKLGFVKEKAIKYALLGLLFAIPTGLIEYIILTPNPPSPVFDVKYLLRDTIYMVFFVGIAEELLFRGLIFNDLIKVFGWKSALLGQGALFGVMHMTWRSPLEIAFTFAAGLILGYFYYRTKSLAGPIAMHAVNNILLVSILPYLYPSITGWFS